MIVNKPQFDTLAIEPGSAYWLKRISRNGHVEVNQPCLIESVSPLQLIVSYYDPNEEEMMTTGVNIDSVINGIIELTPMVKEGGDTHDHW